MTSRLESATLRIGDIAPPIVLPGLDGEIVELAEARGVCGVVLLFAPGAWSPATRRQVGEINAIYEQFREAGVQVLVSITQKASSLQDRLSSYAIPFPIVADEHRQAAREYGVYRAVSWDGFGVTRPAVFMIDREGIIRFVYAGQSDTDWPDVESLLRLSSALIGGVEPTAVAEAEIGEAASDGAEAELEEIEAEAEPLEIDAVLAEAAVAETDDEVAAEIEIEPSESDFAAEAEVVDEGDEVEASASVDDASATMVVTLPETTFAEELAEDRADGDAELDAVQTEAGDGTAEGNASDEPLLAPDHKIDLVGVMPQVETSGATATAERAAERAER